MKLDNITEVRRLGVLTVAGNVAAAVLAAALLPSNLLGVLPIVGLVLPLLTSSALEAAAERRLGRIYDLANGPLTTTSEATAATMSTGFHSQAA